MNSDHICRHSHHEVLDLDRPRALAHRAGIAGSVPHGKRLINSRDLACLAPINAPNEFAVRR
jgi:hypothetical protein